MDYIFYYILLFGWIAMIIYHLIKSHRKTALKILITGILCIATMTLICAIIYLFGDIGAAMGMFIGIEIEILLKLIPAVKRQIYITKLHQKGCRTIGTLTNNNHISYQADGKDYEYIGSRLKSKWKIGDEIPVLYDPESPENSCIEKYDRVSAISSTAAFSILEAAYIGSIIYVIIICSI
ncbi:MAG: hypothetical protein K2J40_10935 [Ruminococcus sp.]|nr:hypothetical protein [Ruminococcus sp.]